MKLTKSQRTGMLYAVLFISVTVLWRVIEKVNDRPGKEVVQETAAEHPEKSIPEKIDLNTADTLQLMALPGIGPVLSKRIVRYRERIGGFATVQELEKIYGIDAGLVVALEEKLVIHQPRKSVIPAKSYHSSHYPKSYSSRQYPSSSSAEPQKATPYTSSEPAQDDSSSIPKKKFAPKPLVDINRADSAGLVTVYGIGAKTAGRIVKYRRLLGFFNSIDQIKEVYGVSEENFERMKPQLMVSLEGGQKLNINTATKEELARHPYIKWEKAPRIVAYREQHGAFGGIEDLANIREIGEETWEMLRPYLLFK